MEERLRKKINEYVIIIISLILSFISILGCICKYDIMNEKIIFNGNNYIYIIVLITYFSILRKTIKIKNKRLSVTSIIFSLIITSIYIISYLTSNYFLNDLIPTLNKFIFMMVIKSIAVFILLYTVIKNLFIKLTEINIKVDEKKFKFFSANKRSICFVAILIFISYIPHLINSYPGNLTYDFAVQIRQALGYEPIVNHHPYVHTELIRTMYKIRV